MYIDTKIEDIIGDNMMNYAQYVIKNRALPDLYSGVKPIHLKILWSMYENKTFDFTKSANVSGRVMEYSPHGDCYETIVNMVQKDRHVYNLIEGQGNWGASTSTQMKFGASRYTESKISDLGIDCMQGISKNMVDMIDNYDNSKKMPKYLPTRFPLILCMASSGMAVGMANNSPSFNLKEVCDATISYLSKKDIPLLIPDFATRGYIINDAEEIKDVNLKGVGTLKLRAKYEIDKNIIKITEISYGVKVTVETIIDRIIDMNKKGRLKEVVNVLDQTGIDGLCIEIVCKKGLDMNKVVQKLFKLTPLESNFSVNMNVLIEGSPKVTGVSETIKLWCKFRQKCIYNGLKYDIDKLKTKLHLLHGLEKVLLDIDKTIEIIRHSKQIEKDLTIFFSLEKNQIEYIVNMKLSNINEKHIMNQIKEIKKLEKELEGLEKDISDISNINKIIIKELQEISKKYGKPRQTIIVNPEEIETFKEDEFTEDFNCKIFITKEDYIKKIPLTGLRGSGEQKLKPGDEIVLELESTNNTGEILVFTDKANCYKRRLIDISESKIGELGEYLPNLLELKNESILKIIPTNYFKGQVLFCFKDGKIAKIPLQSYWTEQNRKMLKKAYSIESKLINIIYLENDIDLIAISNTDKVLLFNTSEINSKATRTSIGVQVLKLKKDDSMVDIKGSDEVKFTDLEYYRSNISRAGKTLKKDVDFFNC